MSAQGFRAIRPAEKTVRVTLNGERRALPADGSLLAGLLQQAERLDWFCAIGQCQRCRVQINGQEALACQVGVQDGDIIDTPGDWSG